MSAFMQWGKRAARMSVCILWASMLCEAASAQAWRTAGDVRSAKSVNPYEALIVADNAQLRVYATAPGAIRLRYVVGEPRADFSYALDPERTQQPQRMSVEDGADVVTLRTPSITLRVSKHPLRVAALDADGRVIAEDDAQRPAQWNGSSFDLYEKLPAGEHYYGLGDKAGELDHLGESYVMWNTDAYGWGHGTDPLYQSVPFFMGLRDGRAYGVYFDNSYRSRFDFGKRTPGVYSFGSEGGELNYYLFAGPTPRKVIEQFTALVGRTPLPPLWSLGYQQSRYSYYPESRVREIAKTLREKKIPADAIYLDIDYEENHRSFSVDQSRFPSFDAMVKELAAEHFKVVAIVDLHLQKLSGYKPYDEGLAGDHFVKNPNGSIFSGKVWPGECVFPEFSQKRTREWFGSLYKSYVDAGVMGIWNDMNEPAVWMEGKTMPLDTVHRINEPGLQRATDHREMHNLFGMLNVMSTFDGLRKLRANERPFILTRAAFAGAWRYAATWTGDNAATWEHYRVTLPTLMSLGVSGYTQAGADVGGFALSPTPELATRWMELGAFQPLYRNHTATGENNKEPWAFGAEHEAIQRKYVETRYKLLPYLYTAFEEASRTGLPVMRPLLVDYPTDAAAQQATVFQFGDDLIVAPKPDETPRPYEVVLPAGKWFDFWNGSTVEGGKSLSLAPALDVLPVYVRAGAILPEQPLVQSTDETPQGPLTLRVYPGPDCKGSIYADDGHTYDYRRGAYFRESFACEASASGVKLTLGAPTGAFHPWWKSLRVLFVGEAKAAKLVVSDAAGRHDAQPVCEANACAVEIAAPQVGEKSVSLELTR